MGLWLKKHSTLIFDTKKYLFAKKKLLCQKENFFAKKKILCKKNAFSKQKILEIDIEKLS